MNHSIEELFDVVYRHYPRGVPTGDPHYKETEEYRRLSAARRAAGAASEPWRALLRRLDQRFPECGTHDDSLHLPMGTNDACYAGALLRLPPREASTHTAWTSG